MRAAEPDFLYGYCQGCKEYRALWRVSMSRYRCGNCADKEARGVQTPLRGSSQDSPKEKP